MDKQSMIPAEAIEAAAIALEDAALSLIGNDLGTIYRNDIVRAALQAVVPDLMARAWEEGCRKGLGTNPGWEDEALAANPYRPGKRPPWARYPQWKR